METLLSEEAVTAAIGSVYEGRSHKRTRIDEYVDIFLQGAPRTMRTHRLAPHPFRESHPKGLALEERSGYVQDFARLT